jgi:hypothetical protein
MSDDFVWMTHPTLPGDEQQKTTQSAFDNVWDALGWEIVVYDPENEPDVLPPHLTLADKPNLLHRANHVGLDDPLSPPSSTLVDRAEITADITGIVIDTLNIDLISGLAVDIPDLDVAVKLEASLAVSHSVANATINAALCFTSPTPTTILNSIGQFGFCALSAIGSKGLSRPTAFLPAHTPCTVQAYLAGTGGTAAISAQLYSECWLEAWTAG